MNRDEAIGVLRRTRFSRFPFSASGDPDEATGIVLAKELLLALEAQSGDEVSWDKLVRDPLVVPPSRPVQSLLPCITSSRSHMCLVMDEYGTFLGIVTHEDLLEEIVGEIYDETDRMPGALWIETPDGFRARATIDVRKVCAELGLKWSPEEDSVTLGGLITDKLEHIPGSATRSRGVATAWKSFAPASAGPKRSPSHPSRTRTTGVPRHNLLPHLDGCENTRGRSTYRRSAIRGTTVFITHLYW